LGSSMIKNFLDEIDNDFKPSLSSKVSLETYAEKLNSNAFFILAILKKEVVGLAAFYANDVLKKETYLPIIGVRKKFRGKGIADKMIKILVSFLLEEGFEKLSLETWQGSPAQYFYRKHKFVVDRVVDDRNESFK